MISEAEKRGILAGRTTRLIRPRHKCELGLGQRVKLHDAVYLRVSKIRPRGSIELELYFTLEDHRPRLLHRNSSHGYTATPAQAMSQEPEAVPSQYQRLLTMEAGAANAMAQERQRSREAILRAEAKLNKGSRRALRARRRQLAAALRRDEALQNAV